LYTTPWKPACCRNAVSRTLEKPYKVNALPASIPVVTGSPRFFAEKRAFFLESANNFTFGTSAARGAGRRHRR